MSVAVFASMSLYSRRALASVGIIVAAMTLGPTEAFATDAPIAVGEVAPPPPGAGIDAAALRDAAEGEIRQIDPAQVRDRRRVVVSIAVTRAVVEGPVVCTVNATLRDARTGAMIAVIEAGAQAQGPGSLEVRKQVAQGAVRSAVRRIPTALAAK